MYILILLLCITLLPLFFMGCRGIKVKEDYFFIIFIFFGFLYIIIAPALTFISGDIDIINDGEIYPEIQIFLLIFFLLPLIFSYRLFKNIIPTNSTKNYYFLSGKKLIFFCTFFIFFEILFIILALNKNMYFRRIGTEEIADLISRLDIFTLIILRTHDLIILPAITLLALLLPSLKIVKRASLCSLVYFTHFILVCSFIIFALMNSRLQLVFLAIALLYGWLLAGNDRFKLSGGVIILLLGGLFYGLIVVSNIRNYGIEAEISNILNPISFITEQNSIAFNKLEWVQRLDCVELIAKMDDNLKRQGYEWGRAWENPLIATFGSLVGSDSAFDLKATGLTTAKSFLIERHTDIGLKDYSSCMATDLWGNFWIYGLPVASILIAFIFAMLRYGLTNPFTPAALVISIVCAFYFVIFEKEFLDWAIGWIKLIPAIIILVALNPIKKIDFSNS